MHLTGSRPSAGRWSGAAILLRLLTVTLVLAGALFLCSGCTAASAPAPADAPAAASEGAAEASDTSAAGETPVPTSDADSTPAHTDPSATGQEGPITALQVSAMVRSVGKESYSTADALTYPATAGTLMPLDESGDLTLTVTTVTETLVTISSSAPLSQNPSGADAGTTFSVSAGEELWLYRTDDTLLLHLYRITPLAS